MATNPGTEYPGRVTAPDANYPYGSSKDETAPGAGDGTPYKKIRADDIFGLQQALLVEAGIVPSGNADTGLISQYKDAMKVILGGAGLYQNDIDYPLNSYTKGSDGLLYKALIVNGPGSSVVSPIGNPATWKPLLDQATTTEKGVLELATAAEAQAFSDAVRALTPATLNGALQGANVSLGSSGYQKLPGGLIIQWGAQVVTGAATPNLFSYPLAFPNAGLQLIASSTSVGSYAGGTPVSTTQFNLFSSNTGAGVAWLAVGH